MLTGVLGVLTGVLGVLTGVLGVFGCVDRGVVC